MENRLRFFCYFIIITSFVYVLHGMTGLNLPAYYPTLHKWSIIKQGTAIPMGYYSKLFLSLIVGGVFAGLGTLLHKNKKTNISELVGFTKGTTIFAILFFIAEEWHKWGIEKMKLDSEKLVNPEFWLYIGVFAIFLFSLRTLNQKEE